MYHLFLLSSHRTYAMALLACYFFQCEIIVSLLLFSYVLGILL